MATPNFSFSLRFLLSPSLLLLCLLCSLKKGYAYEGRETTESHHLQQSHVVQLSSLLPAAVCNPSTKGTQNRRASLKVVHKHGPCSELYQGNAPNHTLILLQDQARVNSLQSKLSNSNQDNNNIHASAVTIPAKDGRTVNAGNYVITVGLGTPPKQLSLIFDTGSDLTWTQCQPCAKFCHAQKDPIFDPTKSASYTNVTCNSPLCNDLTSATGNTPGCSTSTCVYGIQYGDQSFSVGFFGKEKLTLTSNDVFDNFLFGCGQNNQGLFGQSAGLFGLGRDKLSFVSQSAQKYGRAFSYCLPSTPSSTGYLSFGKGGSGGGKFTSLLMNSQNPSFYFINLIAISVGGQKLSIPASVFSTAGTLIDSGTVITRLPATAYAALRTAFRQGMSKYPTAPALSILDTCYDLSKYSSVNVPKISFFFSGGVEMDLDSSGILYVGSTSQVCLAVAGNSDDSSIGIFGNVQQKTFDISYDVAGGKLGFGPGGCS
ncbi:hypothetical protein L1049_019156 [Liquidambar formosana]|uniref:Peptidase A1 domain-containing protein n=1 Tax=Liquidambar formosana TaxID=63359 RepID=A0AAP0WMR1_LIQFO